MTFGSHPLCYVALLLLGGMWFQGQTVRAQSAGAYGVVYRPESTEYRVVETEHFDYIYQAGTRGMVRRTAAALEGTWPGTRSLVGSVEEDFWMPVVINNYNDQSNGFVHPFPFRQEIETPSIKSDPIVARASTWPAAVAPHELVHAAHAEVDGTIGLGSLVRPFAPDMARGINFLAPSGLLEGVAVYRESRLEPDAGRLNAPLFRMKMKAAMMSDDPWSLTQMLEPPAYTQPFNRYYLGGGHAFEYLAERGDSTSTQFFQSTVAWHNRLPMFGLGVWLGISTGQFPHQLGSEIQAALRDTFRTELENSKPFTPTTLISGARGLNHRRPYWLDEDTLVAYVHGYDVRSGFYRIDSSTGRRSLIRVQELTEDRAYSLGPDTTALYAGRYIQDALVPRQEVADVERIDLSDGSTAQLTSGSRAFAPAVGSRGTVYAVTNDGPFTRWGKVTDQGGVVPLTRESPRSIRQIAPSPQDSTVVLLVHEDGRQRIYRAQEPVKKPAQLSPWLWLPEAVIHDLCWGPEGRYLLFSADPGGTANAFAYDTESNEVLRLTNVPYGALEPTLSPDRSTLAFVEYRHERHNLVRIPFRPDSAAVLADSLVRRNFSFDGTSSRHDFQRQTLSQTETSPRSYSAWRYLAPRMVYPTLHGQGDDEPLPYLEDPGSGALGVGVGVGIQGADPLQRWAYRGMTYWQDGRLWGEARLQSGAYLLRPSVSIYDRVFSTLVSDRNRRVSVKVEERGVGLGLRLPIMLASNVYQSQLRLGMDAEIRQTRIFGSAVQEPTTFSTRVTLDPEVVLGYRLQQNPRDVVPNTGLVVGLQGEFDAWAENDRESHGLLASIDGYLPVLRSTNTGIRLGVRALFQSRSAIFNTSDFVPRGHSSVHNLSAGPHVQLEAEVTQPLWYIDDGFTLLPFYAEALSIYGFGEMLGSVEAGAWEGARSSIGGGVSLQCRVFYQFNLDLHIGAAYRPDAHDVVTIFR